MFDLIIKAALAGVKDDVKKKLADELRNVAEDFVTKNVTAQVARVLLKGIDEVVEKSVKLLSSDQVEKLAGAYADEIDRQFVDLNQAIAAYVPLQVAVEMAKKEHGNKSAEANAARALRAAGIDEVKSEFGDMFGAILGNHVKD
jgi:hypothetical protein